jgi:hypothetical protein
MASMYENELYHFNPNHDPSTGKFASGTMSGIGRAFKTTLHNKKAKKIAAATAAAAAGLSMAATVHNFREANRLVDDLSNGAFNVAKSEIFKKGLPKAGKVAMVPILATFGGMTVSQFVKDRKAQKNDGQSRSK